MEMVESFHPVIWRCCSSSSSSSSNNDDNSDSNDDYSGREYEGVREEDEIKKDQKEKEKEKICLTFIGKNCNFSIHI
jgi:hypothetical protein